MSVPEALDPLELRPEGAADEAFLRRLYASTRTAELALMPWPEAMKAQFIDMQFDLQHRDYHHRYPDAAFQVVTLGGTPVGRLYLDRGAGRFTLIDLCLLPEHRGRGLGRRLLEAVLAEAAAARTPVRLHVETTNPARDLYRRLGFADLGGQGFHCCMEWRIPATR